MFQGDTVSPLFFVHWDNAIQPHTQLYTNLVNRIKVQSTYVHELYQTVCKKRKRIVNTKWEYTGRINGWKLAKKNELC